MNLAVALDLATSFAANLARGGAGSRVGPIGKRPAQPLVLYEFEACPFCRRVREALTELDLEAEIRPCPKGGARFRPEVIARGGKAQFPYFVDPNNSSAFYESAEIVRYLYAEYGAGPPPRLGPAAAATGALATLIRGARGTRARPSRAPSAPLSLWSFEASLPGRSVRELLCELELRYRLLNLGLGSARWEVLGTEGKRRPEPVLEDPNTAASLTGSRDIARYLRATYALA